jgi:hypothetical protein
VVRVALCNDIDPNSHERQARRSMQLTSRNGTSTAERGQAEAQVRPRRSIISPICLTCM